MPESVRVVLLLVSALIHVLPLAGVLGRARLQALYGVPIDDPNLELAMRHRAVMFGLIGALLIGAAFVPEVRRLAIVGTVISDGAFLGLALSIQGTNLAMKKVVIADVVSLACLGLALVP
jgi:hypothetical protein